MIHELNRKGKQQVQVSMNIQKMVKNIYGMDSAAGLKDHDVSEQDMIDRFMFVQALILYAAMRKAFWNQSLMPMSVRFLESVSHRGQEAQSSS